MKSLRFKLDMPPMANKETCVTKSGMTYTPTEKRKYMKECAKKMREHRFAFKGVKYIRATFVFVCDRPKKSPDGIPPALWRTLTNFYKPTRPDIDNFCKPLQDSMSYHIIETKKTKYIHKIIRGAKIIDDDSNIVSLRIEKVFRRLDQEPHVLVKLKEITPTYEYPTDV